MSVMISGTKITMTRGDTLKVRVDIYDSQGNSYTPVEGDTLRFAAKQQYSDERPVILKDIPYDTCLLHLEPNDTKGLPQPAKLVYDIQITMNDGTVDTFLKGSLVLTEEVD